MESVLSNETRGPGTAPISRIEGIVRKERQRLRAFIRRRIENESDAEDILQDVFTELLFTPDSAESIENLTSWLFTVAKNRIIDWYRKRKTVPIREDSDSDGNSSGDLILDREPGPDESTMQVFLREEIADALDELPEEQRLVFIRHEFEGISFKELAEETGESINTLLSRKRYAVLYLRERLKDFYDELNSL